MIIRSKNIVLMELLIIIHLITRIVNKNIIKHFFIGKYNIIFCKNDIILENFQGIYLNTHNCIQIGNNNYLLMQYI